MEVKIRYANNLDGESKFVDISTNKDVLDLIKAYPWEEESRIVNEIIGFKGSPGITIQKATGDLITIDCLWHNSTLLYNLELIYRKYFFWDRIYSVRNTFDDLLDLVLYFLENEPSMLKNRIKHGRHFILPAYMRISLRQRSSSFENDYNLKNGQYRKYRFSYIRSAFPLFFWSFLVAITLTCLVASFIIGALILLPTLFLAFLCVPQVFLFYKHYKTFKSSAVILKINDNRFSVYHNSSHQVFDKSMIKDIARITAKTLVASSKQDYFLWRITFTEGSPVFISSLLMSHSDIIKEFGVWVNKTESIRFLPLIKNQFAL
jgi:hypothetical protein